MADLIIKRNDIPSFSEFQLLYNDLTPIDLTGYSSVNMFMKLKGSSSFQTLAMTVVSAPVGQVKYNWQSGDLQTAGTYTAEIQVTFSNGLKITCPSENYIVIKVTADIDNA